MSFGNYFFFSGKSCILQRKGLLRVPVGPSKYSVRPGKHNFLNNHSLCPSYSPGLSESDCHGSTISCPFASLPGTTGRPAGLQLFRFLLLHFFFLPFPCLSDFDSMVNTQAWCKIPCDSGAEYWFIYGYCFAL